MIWRRKIALALGALCLGLAALNFAFPPPIKSAAHVSPIVTDHQGRWLSGFAVEDGIWRIPSDLAFTDSRLIERVIAVEDKRFYHHSGVDGVAIIRAMRSWMRAGKAVSGASTITMQLVRQLEPRPRTLPNKAIEAIRAVQLELWMSKDEILAAYLSHAPYGGNIEGVEAASRLYFGKSAQALTDAEIALLISLPQAPEARRPDRRPEAAKRGRDIILRKLADKGLMDDTAMNEALEVAVDTKRHPLPERAWITAYGLAKAGTTRSTLDYHLQTRLETLTAGVIERLDSPVNIAVTVVENRTMAVRAHIASADRSRPGGWIDMTTRQRSPGSTLKPFIYGLAMDDGLLAAGSAVEDAPSRFGNYRPENFNRRYHGTVRIDEALRHSLNVPAVAVLDQIGGQRLESTFTAAGIDTTRLGRSSEDAGLALALGGAGMTVNDIALLYAALANEGAAHPLRWTEDAPQGTGIQIISADAAQSLTAILRQAPTPDGNIPGWLVKDGADIAYKTGTSYGFRDAWAAGYTDDWTVVVWVGRPDGAPRRGETGRAAAAPILFNVMGQLPHKTPAGQFERGADAPVGLTHIAATQGPQILFPPDGAEIYARSVGAGARGFTLSVRSDGDVKFYVNGQALPDKIWKPQTTGFYTVLAVDTQGREARSTVRIIDKVDMALHSPAQDEGVNPLP